MTEEQDAERRRMLLSHEEYAALKQPEPEAERRIEQQAFERARAAGPPWQALIEILGVCRALAESDDFVFETPDVVTRGIEDIERYALAGLAP